MIAVLDGSLRVEPGELLTLLGPSGYGKTTVLGVIVGSENSTQGAIYIGKPRVMIVKESPAITKNSISLTLLGAIEASRSSHPPVP